MRAGPITRRAALLVAPLFVVLALAGPAAAEPSATIRSISGVDGRLQIVLSGSDLGDASLDPATVAVEVADRATTSTARRVGAEGAVLDRRVVLLVDTSGSMVGAGIAGAKAAAKAFLAAAPDDVSIGLVTFSDTAQVAVAPSQDRAPLVRAIDGLVARGETALYDGVALALKTVGAAGLRNVVLLSDGADTSSQAKIGGVVALLKGAEVRLDSVAFRTDDAVATTLQQMVGATSGRLVGAGDTAALATAFRRAAATLANELVITADVPPALAGQQATVAVTAVAGSTTVRDEVVTLLPDAAAAPDAATAPALRTAKTGGFWQSDSALPWALGAVFLAVLLIVVLGVSSTSRKQRAGGRQRRLLSLYTLTGRPSAIKEESRLGDSQIAQSALDLAGRFAERRGVEERLALRLDRAAVPLRPNEWLLAVTAILAAAFMLVLLLTGNGLAALLAGVAGALLPGRWLGFKARRRAAAFEDALPDALQLLAGSLSAGFSLPQAVDAVAREAGQPLAGEFGRAVAEARLGVPVDESLDKIAERMGSENFHWVVMAVRTQREVGGNLAEVLGIVSATMRDRAKLKRQVRALSAEGRLSMYVLMGLPVGMTLYLVTFRRDYLRPLYTEPLGIAMIVFAAMLLSIGYVAMRKIVDVEV